MRSVRSRLGTAALRMGLVAVLVIATKADQEESRRIVAPSPEPTQSTPITRAPASSPDFGDQSAFIADGQRALAEDTKKPLFSGWINGIYIHPPPFDAPELQPDPDASFGNLCPGEGEVITEKEVKRTKFYLQVPAGLPDGSRETEDMYAESCNGRVVTVSRQSMVNSYGAMVGLVLRTEANASYYPTTADRLEIARVNGMRAVVIAPVIESGYGDSAIFLRTPIGLLLVGGQDVPLGLLLDVAESIRFD